MAFCHRVLGVAAGTDGGEAVLFPSPRAAQHRWWIYLSWGHLSGGTRWYSHYPNGKLILPAPICVVTRFHLSVFSLSCCSLVNRLWRNMAREQECKPVEVLSSIPPPSYEKPVT